MGWRLAEEIAWARPERPGPEWWTLMDIAQDARDETRQSMCGTEYLMARAKCSKRTLYRRMEALRAAGLLTVARKSAPGVRAIYAIPVIHTAPRTGASVSGTRTPVDNPGTGDTIAGTRTDPNGCQNGDQRVPESAPTGASVSGTHPVTYPVTTTPSTSKTPVANGSVEGTQPSTAAPNGKHSIDHQALALLQVAKSRAKRGLE